MCLVSRPCLGQISIMSTSALQVSAWTRFKSCSAGGHEQRGLIATILTAAQQQWDITLIAEGAAAWRHAACGHVTVISSLQFWHDSALHRIRDARLPTAESQHAAPECAAPEDLTAPNDETRLYAS
jgi:hypothetical protein